MKSSSRPTAPCSAEQARPRRSRPPRGRTPRRTGRRRRAAGCARRARRRRRTRCPSRGFSDRLAAVRDVMVKGCLRRRNPCAPATYPPRVARPTQQTHAPTHNYMYTYMAALAVPRRRRTHALWMLLVVGGGIRWLMISQTPVDDPIKSARSAYALLRRPLPPPPPTPPPPPPPPFWRVLSSDQPPKVVWIRSAGNGKYLSVSARTKVARRQRCRPLIRGRSGWCWTWSEPTGGAPSRSARGSRAS